MNVYGVVVRKETHGRPSGRWGKNINVDLKDIKILYQENLELATRFLDWLRNC
jgi:hypothetical protein